MNAYADTSFLVSLHTLDANSSLAASEITRLNPTLFLTPLGELEFLNALELRIFRGEATRLQINASKASLAEHIASGFFARRPMPESVYTRAEKIAHRHSAKLGLRTLDILHVTSAHLLGAEVFFSFDLRQLKLAHAEGLKTVKWAGIEAPHD